jgi:hypothetical protein
MPAEEFVFTESSIAEGAALVPAHHRNKKGAIKERVGGLSRFINMSNHSLKGTVSRDFLLLVLFMNQFPSSPRVFRLDRFKFFRKFAEIFASQGAPPVSMTPAAINGNNIRQKTP